MKTAMIVCTALACTGLGVFLQAGQKADPDKPVAAGASEAPVISPKADPHAHPHAPKVAAAIAGSRLVEIEGGMVPLPDHMPQEFAGAILGFLAGLNHASGHSRRTRGNP